MAGMLPDPRTTRGCFCCGAPPAIAACSFAGSTSPSGPSSPSRRAASHSASRSAALLALRCCARTGAAGAAGSSLAAGALPSSGGAGAAAAAAAAPPPPGCTVSSAGADLGQAGPATAGGVSRPDSAAPAGSAATAGETALCLRCALWGSARPFRSPAARRGSGLSPGSRSSRARISFSPAVPSAPAPAGAACRGACWWGRALPVRGSAAVCCSASSSCSSGGSAVGKVCGAPSSLGACRRNVQVKHRLRRQRAAGCSGSGPPAAHLERYPGDLGKGLAPQSGGLHLVWQVLERLALALLPSGHVPLLVCARWGLAAGCRSLPLAGLLLGRHRPCRGDQAASVRTIAARVILWSVALQVVVPQPNGSLMDRVGGEVGFEWEGRVFPAGRAATSKACNPRPPLVLSVRLILLHFLLWMKGCGQMSRAHTVRTGCAMAGKRLLQLSVGFLLHQQKDGLHAPKLALQPGSREAKKACHQRRWMRPEQPKRLGMQLVPAAQY